MTIVLGIKLVDLLVLRGLDASVNFWAMSICTVVDVITSYLIVASVYPLITVVIKNNEIYSKRKLVEYWFRDIGVLVGGVMLGQTVFGSLIDYNACLVISVNFSKSGRPHDVELQSEANRKRDATERFDFEICAQE